MKCHCCLEDMDSPITLDVQPFRPESGNIWRVVTVCEACYTRLHPDLWISDECLIEVGCKTPFKDLPELT
jgi:hypothetical protein